jgi:hypothetical protein
MIVTTVSFMAAPGRNLEAVEFLQKVSREARKVNGTEARLHQQLGGPVGHYLLATEYDSLTKYDEARLKFQSDPSIQKLIVDSGKSGLFVPGTTTSAIWDRI